MIFIVVVIVVCVHAHVFVNIDLLLPCVFSFRFREKSHKFWELDLEVESTNAQPSIPLTHLTYKQEFYPPYPLDIPNGASFHCSNATYCVEQTPFTDKCNRSYATVNIFGLQVNCVENEFFLIYQYNKINFF